MNEMVILGETMEISPLANYAGASDAKVIRSLNEITDLEIKGRLFRQSGGLAANVINVLLPVFTVYKRDKVSTQKYAICAVAKFSNDAAMKFLGYTFTGTAALFRRSYYYEDSENMDRPKQYDTTRFGTPLLGTFSESQGAKLEQLCKEFTTFEPTNQTRKEIRMAWDDNEKRYTHIDENGNKCPEVDRATYHIVACSLNDKQKQELIEGAFTYFGGKKQQNPGFAEQPANGEEQPQD